MINTGKLDRMNKLLEELEELADEVISELGPEDGAELIALRNDEQFGASADYVVDCLRDFKVTAELAEEQITEIEEAIGLYNEPEIPEDEQSEP